MLPLSPTQLLYHLLSPLLPPSVTGKEKQRLKRKERERGRRKKDGAQSLGKRMHSLGANVVGSETGRGGREGVRTARALCLYSKVSLNQLFMKFSISLHVLIFFRIKKSYVI